MDSDHRIEEDISVSRESTPPSSSSHIPSFLSASVLRNEEELRESETLHSQHSKISSNIVKEASVCVVCGDTSSGKHYGILACNGCSGFFKRSVRRKLIYRCQAGTGMCVIDKAHRNQCQACRLRKCLHMGMNKDAVQNERQPRNTATLRPESFTNMDSHRFLREASVAVGAFGIPITPFGIPLHQQQQQPHHQPPPQQQSPLLTPQQPSIIPDFTIKNPILEPKPKKPLFDYEPEDKKDPGISEDDSGNNNVFDPSSFADLKMYPLTESNHEIAARLLFMAVRWTKNLTSFASLPFRDQVTLLEESWSELFLLCAIQWSMPLEKPSLFSLPNPELYPTEITSFVDQLSRILTRFKRTAVNPAEFACMKAILLFKPETQGLKDLSQVENLQDQALVMLSNHVESTTPHQQQQRVSGGIASSRFGRLLLLLSSLRHSSSLKIEKLYFDRIIGNAKMEKLLCDMFQS